MDYDGRHKHISLTMFSDLSARTGGAAQRQPVRVARPTARRRSGVAAGQRHVRAGRAAHPAAAVVPRELPVRAAVHARRRAAHREGLRDGGRRHLHGAADAARLGQRVHGGGAADAVQRERGEGPRSHCAPPEAREGVQSVRISFVSHR